MNCGIVLHAVPFIEGTLYIRQIVGITNVNAASLLSVSTMGHTKQG